MPRAFAQQDDVGLIAALRRGDADGFAVLVDRHSAAMIRVAMAHVPSRAVAGESGRGDLARALGARPRRSTGAGVRSARFRRQDGQRSASTTPLPDLYDLVYRLALVWATVGRRP
jgi:hypothetical protein